MSDQPRPMTEYDVRIAMHNVPKSYPMGVKLGICRTYCKAAKVSYNEALCIEMIGRMDLEPGDRYSVHEPVPE